jgi:hypothetical protein
VVVPNWIVENQLVIALPPVVSDSFVLVDDESIDAEHFEPSRGRQASLASACIPY